MKAATDLDRTQTNQRNASDPAASAWVIANAGSGKTHVLTQRVIRLLLAGVDPASILCLTFTKVAAAQMASRVFGRLAAWTALDDADLAAAVAEMEGRPPTRAEMRNARRLFARALETPGGLKIQTIHAFCERLLHEFPFEANVPGQFAILDDNASRSLIADARAAVMNEAATAPQSRLGRATRLMAENANDQQIGEALDALIAGRNDLQRWIQRAAPHGRGGIDDALADLRGRLGLGTDETAESVAAEICAGAGWTHGECRDLADALAAGHAGNPQAWNTRAQGKLRTILESDETVAEAEARLGFFLRWDDKGKVWQANTQRLGKAFADRRAGLREAFDVEAARLERLVKRFHLARACEATEALLVVGDAILQAYHVAKRRAGALDFDDLIARTRGLLSRSDAANWVLYKLDRRIEHILVDEAQDTSPDQWAVVQALAEDFFAGEGAASAVRTIFAVGDDKQSIFSFQGAAPEMLVEMQRFFERRIREAEAAFVAVPLFLSFRSTHEVLAAVDEVFKGERAAAITASTYEAHASYRPHEPGHIVVMPRVVRDKGEEPEEWTEPYDAPSAAETTLAQRIADEIGKLRGTVLSSGRRLTDGQILVLVRRRDAFAAAMNRALRARGIPTAGADRVPVSTHIAILDLLALADFVLLPEDDLQLAALLKSPLIGLSEEDLLALAAERGPKSLWSMLRDADWPAAKQAAETLSGWLKMADRMTPFRFFAEILGPGGGRRALTARLGGEAEDVIDVFLSQALAYERLEPPSLQGFVRFVRVNEGDIKRENEEAPTGVRVMTVHGAKGLEADVVFLVDTGGLIVVHGQRDKLVPIGEGRDDPAFLWRRPQKEAPDLQGAADAIADARTRREYLRLLYVAMTRARDILYVAGIRGPTTDTRDEPRWHRIVQTALVPEGVERGENDELAEPYVWPQPLRPPLAAKDAAATPQAVVATLPHWLPRQAPSPPPVPEPLRPSEAIAEPDPRVDFGMRTEEAAGLVRNTALIRGRAVHLLMERLSAVPVEQRARTLDRILARELADDAALAAEVRSEVEATLADSGLEALMAGEGRAEVAIAGRVATARGEFSVSGRIDYLARTPAGWHILDFKTGRTVPASPEAADPLYVAQLALYRRLMMEMQPGAEVAASLVFTAGPKLMPIPAASMENALTRLGVAGMAFP